MIAFKHLVTRSVTRIFLRGQYFDHVPMPTRRHSRWFSLLPVGNRMYLYSLSRWIVYGMKLAHVHVCVTRLRFLPFRLVDPCVREDFSFRLFFFFFFFFSSFRNVSWKIWISGRCVRGFLSPPLYDTVRNTGEEKWKKRGEHR